jgi:hypothetical protein
VLGKRQAIEGSDFVVLMGFHRLPYTFLVQDGNQHMEGLKTGAKDAAPLLSWSNTMPKSDNGNREQDCAPLIIEESSKFVKF